MQIDLIPGVSQGWLIVFAYPHMAINEINIAHEKICFFIRFIQRHFFLFTCAGKSPDDKKK